MKVLLYGAAGMVGGAIATELHARGHDVTAATRGGSGSDVTDAVSVAGLAPGHDAVVSAVRPAPGEGPSRVIDAARTLIEVLPRAGVLRLVVVGGAGGLIGPDGVRAADDPHFDPAYRPFSLAHAPGLGREVADSIPRAQYVEIPDCGHYGHLEDPAAVNDAILRFFGEVAPVPAGPLRSGSRSGPPSR